jgi:hypothetical protein
MDRCPDCGSTHLSKGPVMVEYQVPENLLRANLRIQDSVYNVEHRKTGENFRKVNPNHIKTALFIAQSLVFCQIN